MLKVHVTVSQDRAELTIGTGWVSIIIVQDRAKQLRAKSAGLNGLIWQPLEMKLNEQVEQVEQVNVTNVQDRAKLTGWTRRMC